MQSPKGTIKPRKIADPSMHKHHPYHRQTPSVHGTNTDLSIPTLQPRKPQSQTPEQQIRKKHHKNKTKKQSIYNTISTKIENYQETEA